MGVDGLTIFHIKSHLQKYRLNIKVPGAASDVDEKAGCRRRKSKRSRIKSAPQESMAEPSVEEPVKVAVEPSETTSQHDEEQIRRKKLEEALLLQMEMQKKLYEQLEAQRQLQLSLEQHGRYISSLLEQTSIPSTSHQIDSFAAGNLPSPGVPTLAPLPSQKAAVFEKHLPGQGGSLPFPHGLSSAPGLVVPLNASMTPGLQGMNAPTPGIEHAGTLTQFAFHPGATGSSAVSSVAWKPEMLEGEEQRDISSNTQVFGKMNQYHFHGQAGQVAPDAAITEKKSKI